MIQLLESCLKMSDFITSENYHTRLRPETSKKLIETIRNNFNQSHEFNGKKHTLKTILFENISEFGKDIRGKRKSLEFRIPEITIKRNDNAEISTAIMSIDPRKRKELRINKSTLRYQQRKIKEGKPIKIYN